jgi:hypothetical protein
LHAIKSAITISLLAVTVIPMAAFAQYPRGPGGQPGGGQVMPRPLRDRPAADSLPSLGAPVLVQLDKLENELKLTAEQLPAWNAYADKILHLADEMTRSQFVARTAPQPTGATAAEQLDRLTDSERKRLVAIEEIVAAGKAFYATLTDEQKAVADRKLMLPIRPLATGVPLPAGSAAGSGSGH